MYHPRLNYYAFVHLINALDHAKVAFLPIAYYRFVVLHWADDRRTQHGNEQATSSWDTYRGGLEAMIHWAYRLRGSPGVPSERSDSIGKALQTFVHARMRVALRLLIQKKDFLGAHDVLLRLLAGHGISQSEADRARTSVTARAALQMAAEIVEAATPLAGIGLYRLSNAAEVKAIFEELRPNLPVSFVERGELASQKVTQMLLITGDNDGRDELLHAGCAPGFVKVYHDLIRLFSA
jgi:hypothetical protein